MKITPASDSSLLVVFGDVISLEMQERVLALFRALQARRDQWIRNLHPGYASLLIDFDPLLVTQQEVEGLVESVADDRSTAATEGAQDIEIPVCYDTEFGPDLADVAAHTNLPIDEVIGLHSSATYRVCFLGFTAGFAYLGGLPEALHMPRLATPRGAVAEGSVGIAGGQTGVYPAETPGGWRLIGRTPLRMFDPRRERPSLLMTGDRTRFIAIDRPSFDRLRQEQR
jgi:inhibitor of KinA